MESILMRLRELTREMIQLLDDCQSLNAPSEPLILPKEPYEVITPEQEEEIRYVCREYPDLLQEMIDRLRLEGLEFLSKAEYREHIERLRKIVDTRKSVFAKTSSD